MHITKLCWVGTRTDEYAGTVQFFRDLLGLQVDTEASGFTVLAVPDGSTVEVFGPASEYNAHLVSPVAGFEVEDLHGAEEELRSAGVEIVFPLMGGDERIWLHFRAPDGHVYELVENRT